MTQDNWLNPLTASTCIVKTDAEIYNLAKIAGNIIIISKDADSPE